MSKKRHEEHEEHMDESWLVPYADVLTLLLALFIVLFATSKVDKAKFEEVKESFKVSFGGGSGILDGSRGMLPSSGADFNSNTGENSGSGASKTTEQVKSEVDKYIKDNGLSDILSTRHTNRGLVIQINDSVLFSPGSATILPYAYSMIDSLGAMISKLSDDIQISGYTDDTPIHTSEFPTNWDLSSQRALNFMKYLLQRNPDLNPQRFSAVGYGEYRPLVPNTTEENKAINRRVEILIYDPNVYEKCQ